MQPKEIQNHLKNKEKNYTLANILTLRLIANIRKS